MTTCPFTRCAVLLSGPDVRGPAARERLKQQSVRYPAVVTVAARRPHRVGLVRLPRSLAASSDQPRATPVRVDWTRARGRLPVWRLPPELGSGVPARDEGQGQRSQFAGMHARPDPDVAPAGAATPRSTRVLASNPRSASEITRCAWREARRAAIATRRLQPHRGAHARAPAARAARRARGADARGLGASRARSPPLVEPTASDASHAPLESRERVRSELARCRCVPQCVPCCNRGPRQRPRPP